MRIFSMLFFCFLCWPIFGQQQINKLTPIPLTDLAAFVPPASNWKIVGQVSGNFSDEKLKTGKGDGILFNDISVDTHDKLAANLFTRFEHGDIFLSIDFMMPKNSNSGIYFQGRYEIQLLDSWGVFVPHSSDLGSIYERWNESLPEGRKGYEGHPPRTNASFAPGLWQHLDIEFQAPKFDAAGKKIQSAKFVKVVLNGVVVQENVVVYGPTRASPFADEKATAPLMIQGDHGMVSFRNIKYALLNDFTATLSDLKYEYYEGSFSNLAEVAADRLTRKGNTELIDSRLADNPNKLILVFNGKVNVPETTTYQFTIKKHGAATLTVDGKEIIKVDDWLADGVASVDLTSGIHSLSLHYLKNFSWASTGLGLFISKANTRPVALHASGSMPKAVPTPLMAINPKSTSPELIRSFAVHNGVKKTHVISVGDGSGIHYMYDLHQAALLQIWRGEFLNVTEMWHERGEPQVASPLGASVIQAGRCPLALVTNTNSLPDTLDYNEDLVYKNLTLDDIGSPTFTYQYKDVVFSDALKPNASNHGLTRTISLLQLPKKEELIIRLAEGSSIQEVDVNTYVVDNRFYVQYIPIGKSKPIIRTIGSKTELVLEYNAKLGTTIQYILIW